MRVENDYPNDWDSRRKRVYKRDRYACQNCGRRGGPHGNTELHAHHIVPKSKGGTHNPNNLKTLCKECHDAIHHKDKIAPTAKSRTKKTEGPSGGLVIAGIFCILVLVGILRTLGVALFGGELSAMFGMIGLFGLFAIGTAGIQAVATQDTVSRKDKIVLSGPILAYIGSFCYSYFVVHATLSTLNRLWYSLLSTFVLTGILGIVFVLILLGLLPVIKMRS